MSRLHTCASFTVGLGAGMALASLFAPRTGSEVRNGIREGLNRGAQALKESKSAAGAALERKMGGFEAAIDAGKRAYRSKTGGDQKGVLVAPST